MSTIYSVRELTGQIKIVLEDTFPFVWVRGQVSNLSRPGSGHVYFSLKDEEALLGAVWFRQSRFSARGTVNPLTGEVTERSQGDPADVLADGGEVICGGRINVYGPRGTYQLVVDLVQEVGLGELQRRFEELKKQFSELGWFARERKRPIPRNPVRVALVTAPTGAAQADFLRIAGERGLGAKVRLYATLVQGDGAPEGIARAVRAADADGWAQVLVLIRGGGSLEDLWAFNTETVARAVHDSGLPVVAGIGHEVDVSIADMIADLRAATPSHAAQLLWTERTELAQRVDGAETGLSGAFSRLLEGHGHRLSGLERHLALASPMRRLSNWEGEAARLARELVRNMESLHARLDRDTRQLSRSLAKAGPMQQVERLQQGVKGLAERLGASMSHRLEREDAVLALATARLNGFDPLSPLSRGYALVKKRGRVVDSTRRVAPGDAVEVFVSDGRIRALVEGTDKTTPVPGKEGGEGG